MAFFLKCRDLKQKKKGENICKVPGTAHDIETIKVENLLFKKIDTLGIYTNHHTTRP